jgi:hypothetical protein
MATDIKPTPGNPSPQGSVRRGALSQNGYGDLETQVCPAVVHSRDRHAHPKKATFKPCQAGVLQGPGVRGVDRPPVAKRFLDTPLSAPAGANLKISQKLRMTLLDLRSRVIRRTLRPRL